MPAILAFPASDNVALAMPGVDDHKPPTAAFAARQAVLLGLAGFAHLLLLQGVCLLRFIISFRSPTAISGFVAAVARYRCRLHLSNQVAPFSTHGLPREGESGERR